jgi:FAD synthetase
MTSNNKRKRVLVTGVFDILHPGHIFLIEKASTYGDVIVIVAADENVQKFKGAAPVIPEEQRLAVIKSLKWVKEAYVGQKGDAYLDFALSFGIDMIIIGPNQEIDEDLLVQGLRKRGRGDIEVLRIREMFTEFPLTSSSKIKQKIKEEC